MELTGKYNYNTVIAPFRFSQRTSYPRTAQWAIAGKFNKVSRNMQAIHTKIQYSKTD